MKTGDYVKTKNGKIFKWEETMTTEKFANEVGYDGRYIYIIKNEIKKSSPNIIDLIEVGDYVNGTRVYEKIEHKLYLDGEPGEIFINDDKTTDEPIESVVTKEQFERMEYKVK